MIVVSVGVVLFWCASVDIEEVTGQMGVLGILPFVLFFGTGILSKQDLNNFLWTVVILAMGGLVLGEAVKTSGLLDVIAEEIADAIEYHSLSLWCTLCIFTFLILVCTTFVSHTVGAIVVIPIVQAVGYVVYPSCPRSFIFRFSRCVATTFTNPEMPCNPQVMPRSLSLRLPSHVRRPWDCPCQVCDY